MRRAAPWCGPARCRYAPVGEKGTPCTTGTPPTISCSGPRTETRNVPSTSAWFRDEASPRGSGTEVERPDDRRTEAWRRASGSAPCRQRRRRRTEGQGLTRPIRHLPKRGHADHRRALELLASCPEEGCTELITSPHGFTIEASCRTISHGGEAGACAVEGAGHLAVGRQAPRRLLLRCRAATQTRPQ